MNPKEVVLSMIADLPDDVSLQEIADRVRFLAAIKKGTDELDAGERISIDEVERELRGELRD